MGISIAYFISLKNLCNNTKFWTLDYMAQHQRYNHNSHIIYLNLGMSNIIIITEIIYVHFFFSKNIHTKPKIYISLLDLTFSTHLTLLRSYTEHTDLETILKRDKI